MTGAGRLDAAAVRAAAAAEADPQRIAGQEQFFQAGPGGYGEGDRFIGLRVPAQRAIAKRFRGLAATEIVDLLEDPIHEYRLIGLFCLRDEFDRTRVEDRPAWVRLYLDALDGGYVDNWDLVDSSADPILGEYQRQVGDWGPLVDLAARTDLWPRRAGIVGTFAFLKHGDARALLAIAPLVIDDRRDLIQKAFGWMLREAGKRVGPTVLTDYLDTHAAAMGRTALRYAIEHLEADRRAHYRSLGR